MMKLSIPGFVDLQVNGHKGVNFSGPDLTEASFARACGEILETGTAAFFPTVITSPAEIYRRNLPLMAKVMARGEFGGRLPGFHIEGPFISCEPGAAGAHPPEHVMPPDVDFFKRMHEWAGGRIRLLTVAPEAAGADELIREASAAGITVSLGHSLYTPEDLERAVEAGAKALTHFGNGLPNMLPRHANPMWAGLARDGLAVMIITDGHHLPQPVIKTVLRAKGPASVIVVSDASPLAGLPPGRYQTMGGDVVLEKTGRIINPARQCLAGSSATMMQCMNYLARLGWLDLDGLTAAGFHNPLRLTGVEPSSFAGPGSLYFDGDKKAFFYSG